MTHTEEAPQVVDRVSSGVSGLDEILHGGLTPDRIYLLEGNPGTGKTTLALGFMLQGAKLGEKCLYITLSETAEELRAIARSHGWSLDQIEIFELTPPEGKLDSDQSYTLLHPSEVELSETTRLILHRIEELNPQRVAFDSLSEIRLTFRWANTSAGNGAPTTTSPAPSERQPERSSANSIAWSSAHFTRMTGSLTRFREPPIIRRHRRSECDRCRRGRQNIDTTKGIRPGGGR